MPAVSVHAAQSLEAQTRSAEDPESCSENGATGATPHEPAAMLPEAEGGTQDSPPATTRQVAPPSAPVSIAPWEDIPPEYQAQDEGQPLAQPHPQPDRMPLPQQGEATLVLPVVELPAPRIERPPSTATPPSGRRLVPTELGETWHALAETLIERSLLTGIARELLLQSQLLQQAEQEAGAAQALWTIRVESETLNHEGSRKRLEGALAELGHAVLLRIECGRVVDTPGMRLAKARAAEQERAEQTFTGHPYVQAMMRDLGAQPVAGSIRFTREPGAQGA